MFSFDLTDKLKLKIKKLVKKDRKKAEIINKKIREIINNDYETIKRYKNLKYDMSNLKEVHIDKSFVLTFTVDIAQMFILFVDFDHHDKIFWRR
ncbi:addiction module toxin RelE [Candidatus Pacearchaeota archaeon]|nr:addiction module toxin RelE [Candidatus Pacearchaeota archaeon]